MRPMKILTAAVVSSGLVLSGVAHADASRSINMLPKSASVAKRGSAPAADESEIAKRGSAWLLALLAVALVVGGALILADGDDSVDSNG